MKKKFPPTIAMSLLHLMVIARSLKTSEGFFTKTKKYTSHLLFHHRAATCQFSTLLHSTSNSGSSNTNSSPPPNSNDDDLIHPKNLFDGIIPSPKALSPSAAYTFKRCPQSYLFQYLYKIKEPKSAAQAKGTVCHAALEKLFELDRAQRDLKNLQNLFRESWVDIRDKEEYQLFLSHDGTTWDTDKEREWGLEGLNLLYNYMELEDPQKVSPFKREMWVTSKLPIDSRRGATAGAAAAGETGVAGGGKGDDDDEESTFLMRGIIDRLDFDWSGDADKRLLRIIDYKTSKCPDFKYSRPVNERIAEDAVWQLKIYALLLRQSGKYPDARFLRLLYLAAREDDEGGRYLEFDLGETREQRDQVLQDIHRDLSEVWIQINRLVELQDATVWKGCDKEWCFCHSCREKFVSGTVWERESP